MKRKSSCFQLRESQLPSPKNEEKDYSVLWCNGSDGYSDSRKRGLRLMVGEVRESVLSCELESVLSLHSPNCRHAQVDSHPRTDQESLVFRRDASTSLLSIDREVVSSQDSSAEAQPFCTEVKASTRLWPHEQLTRDLISIHEPICDNNGPKHSNQGIGLHGFQNDGTTGPAPVHEKLDGDDRYYNVSMLLNILEESARPSGYYSSRTTPRPPWSSTNTADEELALLFKYTHFIGRSAPPEGSPK